jgi:tetratricopeptide (TPR) repeat protein
MNNLALAYRDQRQYAKAEPLFVNTLELQHRVLGADHPETLNTKHHLALMYQNHGQFPKAEELFREVVQARRRRDGDGALSVADALGYLGYILVKQQKYEDGELVLREDLQIHQQQQPDGWRTFQSMSLLGACLASAKRYVDAEPLLLAGYEGLREREIKIPPAFRVRLTLALDRLVRLYDSWEKPDQAAHWRQALAARQEAEQKKQ